MRVAVVDSPSSYAFFFDYLKAQDQLDELITYREGMGPEACDIVLSASAEWNSRSATLIGRAKRAGLPTLHVVDGVVKWGTAWPSLEADAIKPLDQNACLPAYQPVLSHKIACLGPAQGRLLCSWGQSSKVEVTGNPRMDPYINHSGKRRGSQGQQQAGEPARLLILVANRPGYTNAELERARQALHDLNTFLQNDPVSNRLTVTWRIGPRSPAVMPPEVVGSIDRGNGSLLQALERADLVISSPSTATLEAMSMDIPTCILDYVSSPELLHAAWMIRCKDDLECELHSLLSWDERRLQFQRYLIHDQMRLDSPASPRVSRLMKAMITIAETCRSQGTVLAFPSNMDSGFAYSDQLPYHYEPEKLFPAHPVFARPVSTEMARELANLQHYCSLLETTLEQLTQRFSLGLVVKAKIKLALHRWVFLRRAPR